MRKLVDSHHKILSNQLKERGKSMHVTDEVLQDVLQMKKYLQALIYDRIPFA